MKRTITGWMPQGHSQKDYPSYWSSTKQSLEDVPVTITYDDGKPNTKTVWEWMFFCSGGCWAISDNLRTEAEARAEWGTRQYKKLREFTVEVGE